MSRPIIFIASKDREFELTTFDAILDTHHGLRRAADIHDVWSVLTEETADHIAMAIIDLDFDVHGLALVNTLCSTDPDFPILAVTSEGGETPETYHGCKTPIHHMVKPVGVSRLQEKIIDLCTRAGVMRKRKKSRSEAAAIRILA